MKIGLDMDEVIAEFLDSLLLFYENKTGKKHKKEDFKEYKWWPVWGTTREEAIAIADDFHDLHNIEEVKPVEFAVEKVNNLLSNGDELFLITARPSRFKKKVEEWMKHHIKTEKIKVFHAVDFHNGKGARKSEICKELGIKLMLEDSGETAIDCAENGINVLLFDKPWNKDILHKNITRVRNWNEAAKEIDKMRRLFARPFK